MNNNKRTVTNSKNYRTTLHTNLNKAYRSIRYHSTTTYMTKYELATELMGMGFAKRTSYRFIENLENTNKLKTVNLYKIK